MSAICGKKKKKKVLPERIPCQGQCHTGTHATLCCQIANNPSWQYSLYKADTLANNKLIEHYNFSTTKENAFVGLFPREAIRYYKSFALAED